MKSVMPALACLLVLGLSACGSDINLTPPAAPPSLSSNVVALTPDQLTQSQYADEADRTPSAAEIRAAITVVRDRFGMIELSPSLKPFGDYYLQFAGLRGHRVAVNALCSVDRMNWRSGWITVNDGGDCFWHAVVRNGRIETFSVNGNA